MTYHPADPSPQPFPSEPDCLQAEFVPAEETTARSDYAEDGVPEFSVAQTVESAIVTLEPTLQTTDSFEFNYVDRPAPSSSTVSAAPDTTETLTRLFTPWSLVGLFLLVLANGLLTMHSFARYTAPPPVAVTGFNELPPVSLIPPDGASAPNSSLAIDQLSGVTLPKTERSPAVLPNPGQLPPAPPVVATAPVPAVPPPQPPASLADRLLPPTLNPQQGMVPTAPPQGYATYATPRANAPQPPQPPNNFPTVAVRPVYQPQTPAPLPPPPPPPLSQAPAYPTPPNSSPPISTNTVNTVGSPAASLPPNPAAKTASTVESQMRQQLPVNPGSSPQSASNSVQPSNQPPGTRSYNQSPGIAPPGLSPTQQLVQELESLNQAP